MIRLLLCACSALPLAVLLLTGSVSTGRAQVDGDMCKTYCLNRKAYGHTPSCLAEAAYINGLGCLNSLKEKQEPCATALKVYDFMCMPKPANVRTSPLVGDVCSAKWTKVCHQIAGIASPERQVAPPSYSIAKIPPQTAKLDICTYFCPSSKSFQEVCTSLVFYVGGAAPEGAGCGDPKKAKQEPCATLLKQLTFICNEKNFNAKPNGFCSKAWDQACHDGGWPPAKISIPGGGGTVPVTPAKTIQSCPPNMMPNANRTGCVPKLDMPGDATPGSVPGAGRAMPGGGATPPPRR